MKLKGAFVAALNYECPYCHAPREVACRIMQGRTYTNGEEPRDFLGWPLIHEARAAIVLPDAQERVKWQKRYLSELRSLSRVVANAIAGEKRSV